MTDFPIAPGTIYTGPWMYSHSPEHKQLPPKDWRVWDGTAWVPFPFYEFAVDHPNQGSGGIRIVSER